MCVVFLLVWVLCSIVVCSVVWILFDRLLSLLWIIVLFGISVSVV